MKASLFVIAVAACSSAKSDPTPSNAAPVPAPKPVEKPAAKPALVDTDLGAALAGYVISLPAGAKVSPDPMSEPGTAVRIEVAPYDLTVKKGAGDLAFVRTEIEKQSHDAAAGVKIRSQSDSELVWTMRFGQDVWEFITVVTVGDAKLTCRSTIPRETEADMRAELDACKSLKKKK